MSQFARDLLDLDRYPIDRPGAARDALIAEARAAIDSVGCAVLKGFVRAERIPDLVAECDRTAPFGHRNFNRTNPYFTQDRPDLPTSHPLRRFYDRSNAFVPADNFGTDSLLRALYEWPARKATALAKRAPSMCTSRPLACAWSQRARSSAGR